MQKKKMLGVIAGIILLGALLTACSGSEGAPENIAEKPAPLQIKSQPVQKMDMTDTLNIYGTVAFRQESFLASQFEGRLSDFSLLIGDRVHKGQKIATIIPPSREALMQVNERVSPEVRKLLGQQIKSIDLFSPIDGAVVEVMRHTGDVLQKGEQIVHIGDDQKLQIHADIPVQYIPFARNTKHVSVEFPVSGLPAFELPVAAISAKVDPQKQAGLMRLDLANPQSNFRPGMLAKLSFPAEHRSDALVVPHSALLEEEGVFSLFVVKGNVAEKRVVQTGIVQKNWVEIRKGVRENERVAIEKVYSLEDGMEVQG